MTRRLYTADEEDEKGEEEIENNMEDFTRQLKNSGWKLGESREIVTSGYIAWRRRIKRRLDEGQEVYRIVGRSLQTRTRRRLTGKVDWYETVKKRKRD